MTTDTDLRELVLSFAATLAARAVDGVKVGGLMGGGLKATIDAGGVEWTIIASYDIEEDTVRVVGKPTARTDDEFPPGMPEPLKRLFGSGDDDAFDHSLPASWLPRAEGMR